MKFGLSNIRTLLRHCGNPQKKFPSVHIAGTNGKGSTSSMIAAVLQAAGYKTGLYTSPHITLFNERIRINGKMISDDELIYYIRKLRPTIDSLKATFFEATTAVAFEYFADEKVDIAVVETGLGGRLDATNVLSPEVSVITSIGRDHTRQLGRTLKAIAYEKGGIIKPQTPCVTSVQKKEVMRELRSIAIRKRSRLIVAPSLKTKTNTAQNLDFQMVTIQTGFGRYENLRIPLLGSHQIKNAALAITALECLQAGGMIIPREAFRMGLRGVRRLTGLRGRFEILRKEPLIILDVGHNPSGISATVETLRNYRRGKTVIVFGVMGDKEYRPMIRSLALLKPEVFAVRPDMERALPAETISALFRARKCKAQSCSSVASAVEKALRNQNKNDLLMICGSHYIAGEALESLRRHLRSKKS